MPSQRPSDATKRGARGAVRPRPVPGRGPRVVLTRPDHLGDVLSTLPCAALLRRALPSAQLAYVAAPPMGDLLRRCADLDEVYPVRFPPPDARAEPAAWGHVVRAGAANLRGRFDIALLLRPDDPWSGALVTAAGIPVRIGFAQPRTRPFLTRVLPEPAGCHVRALGEVLAAAALDHLGCVAPPGPADANLTLTPDDHDEADAVAARAGVGGDPILLHPGSGWRLKNWPAARWGALATALHRRHGAVPLVIGGPGEAGLVAEVVAEAGGPHAVGVEATLSLGGLAALQSRARLVVSTDSGAAHLAAMVGAPLVALYGPGDPVGFRPWSPAGRLRVVRTGLPCSPCGSFEAPPCGATTEPACVTGITVEAVLAAAEELLGPRAHSAV